MVEGAGTWASLLIGWVHQASGATPSVPFLWSHGICPWPTEPSPGTWLQRKGIPQARLPLESDSDMEVLCQGQQLLYHVPRGPNSEQERQEDRRKKRRK